MHLEFVKEEGEPEPRYMSLLLFLTAVIMTSYFSLWIVLGGLFLAYVIQFNIWYAKREIEEQS